ncbi:hypothetical protein AB7Z54_18200 [Providencia manganoxydans]|uniref:hypothetical protein n=1 Tax=Providencia TaxID=586 RepID=UPI002AFED8A8|nr:hypothetical protein [Providencia sp. 23021821]
MNKKVKVVLCVVIAVIVIAAISINFLPYSKVKNYTLANYCSGITKDLMKSPSSYKLTGYSVDWTTPSKSEIDSVLSVSTSFKDMKDLQWAKVYSENTFLASNSFGVELSGFARCEFMRIYFGSDLYYYTLIKATVDGKKVDGINLITAEVQAKDNIGSISEGVTYMQKLKYLFSMI